MMCKKKPFTFVPPAHSSTFVRRNGEKERREADRHDSEWHRAKKGKRRLAFGTDEQYKRQQTVWLCPTWFALWLGDRQITQEPSPKKLGTRRLMKPIRTTNLPFYITSAKAIYAILAQP